MNLPEGVNIYIIIRMSFGLAQLGRMLTLMPGGLNGYSEGNMIIP
jgi:hypothetical protein